MTALSNILQAPAYYAPDVQNISHSKKDSKALRIFFASLPFIALHQPFGRAITVVMDLNRTFSSLNQLNFRQLSVKKDFIALLKPAVMVAALAGTLFMHPLGLCIGTLYDLGVDLTAIVHAGGSQEGIFALLSLAQHSAYLGTMIFGSLEVIAISLLLHMAVEMIRSIGEFHQGHLIEGVSHALMSLVRAGQAVPYMEKVADLHDMKGREQVRTLNETIAKIRNHAAIFFYSSARFFIKAHWKMTEFGLKTISLYKEIGIATAQNISLIAQSAFSSLALVPFAVGGLIIGQAFHFSAFLMSTAPYIHLQSNALAKKTEDKTLSIFQLNCCLTSGGFARWFGGVVLPNDERVLKIAEMIKENHPDLVCLQEVSDLEDGFALCHELSDQFSEFYLNIGPTPFIWQNNSGLFVASKVAMDRPEFHGFSDISGTELMVNKGFFVFSTEIAHFITTHLSPSSDDLQPTDAEIKVRAQEQDRILLAATQRSSENNRPVCVVGDFNIPWGGSEYQRSLLFTEGTDPYNQQRQGILDDESTAETEYLKQRNWHHEKSAQPQRLILDYFLSFFRPPDQFFLAETRKIPTYDVQKPKEALSDHAALATKILHPLLNKVMPGYCPDWA